LEKAHHELTFEPRFDKVIVNDILEDAFIQSEKLVRDFLKP
jgi:guanylate kinase